MGMCKTMLRLKKAEGLKKKAFTVNRENIKQKICDFHLGKEAFKVDILSKFVHFLRDLRVQFEPMLGQKCASVCIYAKRQEYERSNWHANDLHVGN